MARLGEQLIAAGLVDADTLEQALRAQVVWGGRLGTNLIEVGCIDLDQLSRALGQQHGIPAALERHFERADPALQALLPTELARELSVLPLLRLSPQRIAVVAADPLRRDALEELARVFGCDPRDGIVMSIAPEMRVYYHLERVYGVARSSRYLRKKGAPNVSMPELSLDFELDYEEEPEIISPLAPIEPDAPDVTDATEDNEPVARAVDADDIAAQLDHALAHAMAAPTDSELIRRDRRTYLRTLGDEVDAPTAPPRVGPVAKSPEPAWLEPATVRPHTPTAQPVPIAKDAPPASPPSAVSQTTPSDPSDPSDPSAEHPSDDRHVNVVGAGVRADATESTRIRRPRPTSQRMASITGALGRMNLRRVAVRTSAAVEGTLAPTTFTDATRAIKRGGNRDRVAELVIETLEHYVPSCVAALLLVIRGDVAIGWKYFARYHDTPPEVAVPLDKAGIVPAVIARRQTGRCSTQDLGAIDQLLFRELGGQGADLVASPVLIGEHVLCVIAAATEQGADVSSIELVATAASGAFARLIRDASR